MRIKFKSVLEAAVVALAVVPVAAYGATEPEAGRPIGAAKRALAPQIETNDVILGVARAQQPVGKQTPDRTVDHPAMGKAISGTGLRAAVQDARFGEALSIPCPHPCEKQRPHPTPCPVWVCGANSPVVDGAEIVTTTRTRPARRRQATQMRDKDVVLDVAHAQQPVGKQTVDRAGDNPGVRKAISGTGLKVAVQDARFGEAFGVNLNSPIVDAATPTTHRR